jgi:hypothetical protein
MPAEATATLDGIMHDYVEHLLHHLRQLGVAPAEVAAGSRR